MKRRKSSIKKCYRITLGEPEYRDVISILDSIPKTMRGIFIAESIREAKKRMFSGFNPGPTNFIIPEFKMMEEGE